MEVGLGPDHIVLDGDPALSPRKGGTAAVQFSAHVYLAKRLDGSRCHLVRNRPRQGHIVLDGNPAPPERDTAAPPPYFRPMSVVAKRSPISATAKLLLVLPRASCMQYSLQWKFGILYFCRPKVCQKAGIFIVNFEIFRRLTPTDRTPTDSSLRYRRYINHLLTYLEVATRSRTDLLHGRRWVLGHKKLASRFFNRLKWQP